MKKIIRKDIDKLECDDNDCDYNVNDISEYPIDISNRIDNNIYRKISTSSEPLNYDTRECNTIDDVCEDETTDEEDTIEYKYKVDARIEVNLLEKQMLNSDYKPVKELKKYISLYKFIVDNSNSFRELFYYEENINIESTSLKIAIDKYLIHHDANRYYLENLVNMIVENFHPTFLKQHLINLINKCLRSLLENFTLKENNREDTIDLLYWFIANESIQKYLLELNTGMKNILAKNKIFYRNYLSLFIYYLDKNDLLRLENNEKYSKIVLDKINSLNQYIENNKLEHVEKINILNKNFLEIFQDYVNTINKIKEIENIIISKINIFKD